MSTATNLKGDLLGSPIWVHHDGLANVGRQLDGKAAVDGGQWEAVLVVQPPEEALAELNSAKGLPNILREDGNDGHLSLLGDLCKANAT